MVSHDYKPLCATEDEPEVDAGTSSVFQGLVALEHSFKAPAHWPTPSRIIHRHNDDTDASDVDADDGERGRGGATSSSPPRRWRRSCAVGLGCNAGACPGSAFFALQLVLLVSVLALWSPATLEPVRWLSGAGGGCGGAGAVPGTAVGGPCGEPYVSFSLVCWIEGLLFVVLVLTPLFSHLVGAILARKIRAALKEFEESHLRGACIEIGAFRLQVCCGIISAEKLIIRNTQGYSAPYLLSAGKVYIDLNMCHVVGSLGKHIVIDNLDLEEVDLIYERRGGTSNLQELLDALAQPPPPKVSVQGITPSKHDAKDDLADEEGGRLRLAVGEQGQQELEVTVHSISVKDVGARAQLAALGCIGARVSLCDIHYDDLAKELVRHPAKDAMKIVMGSLVKTSLANIAGRSLAERWM